MRQLASKQPEDQQTITAVSSVAATSEDGLIMGLQYREYNAEGVQFHPESILTPGGIKLLTNFLAANKAT